jgi:hypothetical protein
LNRIQLIFATALLQAAACQPSEEPIVDTGPDKPVDRGYSQCEADTHVGNVSVVLEEEYTAVSGTLTDGVVPYNVLEPLLTEDDCVFLYPKELFCDPACASGTTCDEDGDCVPYPRNTDAGTLTLEGLSGPVSMDAIAPSLVYYYAGDLPHPGFNAGDPVELYASGAESYEPFSMLAFGVSALAVNQSEMPLTPDEPSTLTWTPSDSDVDRRVLVEVNIANHGGIPARIECSTLDEGSLAIPAALVNGLLNAGYSGFPSVTVTRQSADTTSTVDGCIDFTVLSSVTLSVAIPGLVSCSSDEDCPNGQTCLPDLTCG